MIQRHEAHARLHELIPARWSPRAFDRSDMPQEDIEVILEAGGWAPSAYNVQPWTFLYALRGDENWDRFLSLLIPFNQSWAKDASALVYVVSAKNSMSPDGEKPNPTHSFDTGAAWALAALQAQAMGYHTHGMIGIDIDKAMAELGIPDDHALEAAFVIGRMGNKEDLPEGLREREEVSGRKGLAEIAKAGNFA